MSEPLVVCPVCETQQPNAWHCALCGKALHPIPRHYPVAAPPLEGLETTEHAGGEANVAGLPVEGFEPNGAGAGNVALEAVPDLERTALAAAPALPADPVPELETTAHEPVPAPPVRGATACLYCGTPVRPGAGRFCPGCGMRLAAAAAAPDPAPPPAAAGAPVRRVCPSCSARDQAAGERCLSCGRPVPAGG